MKLALFLVFTSYVLFLLIRFKKPLHSISDSWYRLHFKGLGFLFTLWCYTMALLIALQGGAWFFASACGMGFVGAATMFRWKGIHTDKIHYAGAATAILGALAGLWREYDILFPIVGLVASAVILKLLVKKTYIWWVELAAFAWIMLGLLYA